jgi:hypothetical protein
MNPTINVARLADKRASIPLGLRLSPAADCFMISHSNTLVRLESPGSTIRGAIVISYVQRSRLPSSSKSSWSTTPQRLYGSSSRNAVRSFPSLFTTTPWPLDNGLVTDQPIPFTQIANADMQFAASCWNPCKSVSVLSCATAAAEWDGLAGIATLQGRKRRHRGSSAGV